MSTIYPGWEPFLTSLLLECLVSSEYQALTDVKREYFRMIVSCGEVNFNIGKPIRTAVMEQLFPEGTQTYANIQAILAQQA